ncbi:kelch-like protein 24 [Acanthaster planci]|uniref:Kelch-like protein 24 n=1 Tax=Acanthaster planci TaxID=133434 RepID=A0A8B7XUY1_ACAPL|nr:kelch-like protein 24 [Acanthaster planci]XP_022084047.1 kelch-like protein 24 [Acanthaster planci]
MEGTNSTRTSGQKSEMNIHVLFQDTGQSSEILTTLNKMRKQGQLTDVTVHVGCRTIPCHRAILACCSEYFLAMFSNDLRESDEGHVYLDKMDADILELLVEYAYTSTIIIDTANAQALLEAAHRLQFAKVVEACCDFMESNLDPSNCLGLLSFADTHSLSRLYQAALAYSLERFEEVCKQEEFLQMTTSQLAEYLSHDALNVSKEETVYRSFAQWRESNKNLKSSDLHRLLRCVRLHYLPPKLLHSVAGDPDVAQSSKTMELVSQAIEIQKKLQVQTERQAQSVSCSRPRPSTRTEVMVVVGGYRDDHSCITDVRFFNPILKKWESLTSIPEPLSGYSVTRLGNCIYVIGGKLKSSFSQLVYRYDIEKDGWGAMSGLTCARQHHGCAVIEDLIFVAGGEQKSGFVAEVESFSASSNQWQTVTELPEPVSGPAIASHRQKLFVVGGQTGQATTYGHIQCLDTVTTQWTVITTVPITSRHFPTLMLNGYMYILGGCGRNGIQVYDPDTDICLPPMTMCNTERHLFAAVALQRQGVIVVAGGMRNYQALTSVEAFSPIANYWSNVVDMPHALRVHGCGVTIHRYLGPPLY